MRPTDELLSVIQAGAAAIGQASEAGTTVTLGGRLAARGTELRTRLESAIAIRLPSAQVRDAMGSGLDGALALGRMPEPGRYAPFVHLWTQIAGEAREAGDAATPASAGVRYLQVAGSLLDRLSESAWTDIRAAAELVASALEQGHDVHAFGSGHSHMLAEEIFYRAGGLARVRPILYGPLMLHEDAAASTQIERRPEIADQLLASHPIQRGDVLIVASNSGGNAVAARLAQRARDLGAKVIAITSLRYALSSEARQNGLPRIHELGDVVIDNGGVVGDAAVEIAGLDRRVGPTSTVIGAAIINALVAEAIEILVQRGARVDVLVSSNVAGGDALNAPLLKAQGLT